MLRQGEILTLSDNNKYTVVSTALIDNENYVYLIDQNDYMNIMFCKHENEELVEVVDEELIKKLMTTFQSNLTQQAN